MLTRGAATSLGLDPALAESPTRVVLITALKLPPAEIYESFRFVADNKTRER
jgi:hypothetical protein